MLLECLLAYSHSMGGGEAVRLSLAENVKRYMYAFESFNPSESLREEPC